MYSNILSSEKPFEISISMFIVNLMEFAKPFFDA